MAKGLESQLSENMEKKLKSEQFQILDPAIFRSDRSDQTSADHLDRSSWPAWQVACLWHFLCDNLDTSFKRVRKSVLM